MENSNQPRFIYAIIKTMRSALEIRNLTKNRLDKKLINSVVSGTLKKSKLKFLNNKKISISLAFVSLKEIKKLNRLYRHKNQPTDILSFAEYQNAGQLKKEKKSAIFLGELVICPADVKDWSIKNNLNYKKELAKTISHGLLHLLGFTHGEKMFNIQEKVSENYG